MNKGDDMSEELTNLELSNTVFAEVLRSEIQDLDERERKYFEIAREVDRVVVVLGCDDSREGVPQAVQELEGVQGVEGIARVLFDYVPSIGGGVSVDVLPGVVDRLLEEGVDAKKITVVTSQHGSHGEVEMALKGDKTVNPTCGLRGVLKKVESGEKVAIPEGLAKHATSTNSQSSMIENGRFVFEKTKEMLADRGVRVVGAYYDHEGVPGRGKDFVLVHGVDEAETIFLPDQDVWHDTHQDPAYLVVSVGARAASLPDGVLLPETVGVGVNNDFNSAGTTEESFQNAMREQWYALSHVGGHGDDHNFEHTQHMVILCDGDEQVGWVNRFMESEEFVKDFQSHVARLGGIHVVNINSGEVNFAEVKS